MVEKLQLRHVVNEFLLAVQVNSPVVLLTLDPELSVIPNLEIRCPYWCLAIHILQIVLRWC